LSKRFGRVTALDQVSFTLRRGEVLGLIGPNGAGKTTLFECVAGQLEVDGGEIRFDDGASARDLFYLPDSIGPWPHQPLGWALEFVLGYFRGDRLPHAFRRSISPT
jgi:ABC-type multidrug transport system ATPase subunit